jgi:anaerobic selenocysteine-containing dehydrogenase
LISFYITWHNQIQLSTQPASERARICGKALTRLEFVTLPHHFFLNSAFNEIDELRKPAGEARVMIHPEAARARGITDGDRVTVFNDCGECSFKAQVTDGTRPGLLVAEGLPWPSLSAGVGDNQLISQRLTDMGETCAFHCNLVEVQLQGKG